MSIQHYRISSPLDTHFRVGTCEEDNCPWYREGWRTVVDEFTSLGVEQAACIREDKTRRHVETKELIGGTVKTVFSFEAGQRCFRQHRVPLDRPELYLVTNQGGEVLTRHSGADAWVDDFCTNQTRLAELINRG